MTRENELDNVKQDATTFLQDKIVQYDIRYGERRRDRVKDYITWIRSCVKVDGFLTQIRTPQNIT